MYSRRNSCTTKPVHRDNLLDSTTHSLQWEWRVFTLSICIGNNNNCSTWCYSVYYKIYIFRSVRQYHMHTTARVIYLYICIQYIHILYIIYYTYIYRYTKHSIRRLYIHIRVWDNNYLYFTRVLNKHKHNYYMWRKKLVVLDDNLLCICALGRGTSAAAAVYFA